MKRDIAFLLVQCISCLLPNRDTVPPSGRFILLLQHIIQQFEFFLNLLTADWQRWDNQRGVALFVDIQLVLQTALSQSCRFLARAVPGTHHLFGLLILIQLCDPGQSDLTLHAK